MRARCALRVNPDIDAGTHDKISTGKADNKFGVPIGRAPEIYTRLAAMPGLEMRGLAVHIGSQLSELRPLELALARARVGREVAELQAQLAVDGDRLPGDGEAGRLPVAHRHR